ncbi:MAG: hypothetical protein PHI73_04555 [Patescibacteria group bacterium]|nr:hypothetical protein [Patescibacteria group bacterium]
MIIGISIKLVCAVLAGSIAVVAGFWPYIRDIYRHKTKPHAYTWLIWTITQGTVFVGLLLGNGGWATWAMALGVSINIIVLTLSLRYGTRNITRGDSIILIAALLAIVVWWQLRNPLLALIMVSLIDIMGYIPSFRKTYKEPWSETALSWAIFTITNTLTIFALSEYNFMTMAYLVSITTANLTLLLICLIRRRVISDPG